MSQKNGFTLIELLIVLAIVGVLACIAYPGYKDHITKARRSDGQTALMILASRMERYYSEHDTYAGATLGTGAATDVQSSSSPEGWYGLAIIDSTDSSFVLQATPLNAQGASDKTCQTLTLNDQGVKGIKSGPAGTPTGALHDCW